MPRKAQTHLCGVPRDQCCGTISPMNHGLGGAAGFRVHASPRAAFECMKRYLLRQGYQQIGSREFSPPDGGPVRVLTRPSHFGGRLRMGKEGSRMQPIEHAGIIISC